MNTSEELTIIEKYEIHRFNWEYALEDAEIDIEELIDLALYEHAQQAFQAAFLRVSENKGGYIRRETALLKLLKQLAEYTDELQQKFDILDNERITRLIESVTEPQPDDAPETD